MLLRFGMQACHFGGHLGLGEQAAEIQAAGLPVLQALLHVQQVAAADHLLEGSDAKLGHDLTHFLGHEEEVVHHMLGLAAELGAQHRVLCGNTHRAGVEVALAHHDAAFHHQRSGGKAHFIGTQQRGDRHVAAGLHLAVGLHAHTAAQAVQHQRLLGFGQADLPGAAGVLDGAPGRSAGATVMAGNHQVVGLALGHAGRDGAHAHFAHQLHADVGMRRHVFQVVNQLCQILDRVDIVMRRRRNQADARHAVAQEADVVAHLAARQLAALARLGALGHLDLDLVGAAQVFGSHAETARCHLLDLAAQAVAGLHRDVGLDLVLANDGAQRGLLLDRDALEFIAVARRILAALAGVALAADAVHGQRQRGVRLGADRAQRHGAGGKALDDLGRRFHFLYRNRLARIELELEQATQRHVALVLVVDDLRVFLVGVEVVAARAVLQLGDGVRRPHVLFATHTPSVLATGLQLAGQHRILAEGGLVHAQGFLGDLEHADAFHAAGSAGEVLLHRLGVQADGFEQLGAAVAHVGAHAHLGHDLGQTLADRLDVVVDGLLGAQIARQFLVDVLQGFQRQVGMHGFGTVAGQHGKVVDLAGGSGFHHQAGGGAQALAHQMLVDGGQRQQRRHGHAVGADGAVADDQDVVLTLHRIVAGLDGIDGFGAQRGQLGFHPFRAPSHGIGDVQRVAAELALGLVGNGTQARHVVKVQDRLAHFQAQRRVDLVDVQQVGLGTDEAHQRHHDRFADRIDRRVGHLGEQLLEVVEQRLAAVGQHGQRAVVAHGADAFLAVGGHGCHQELDVFLAVAEGLLRIQQRHAHIRLATHHVLHRQIRQADAQVLDPLLVGLAVGQLGLQFLVVDHAALIQVDQEHLAGLQAPLLDDLVVGHRQHAGFGPHDDEAVIGHAVARGAQAVAVQRGADLAAVGEHQ